jgi:DNA-binding transcriptional LysR family regulator
VVAVSDTAEMASAKHFWRETPVWAAAKADGFGTPVRLVTLGEGSLTGRIATAALQEAGCAYEVVYVGSNLPGVVGAVALGLGVTCLAHRLARDCGLAMLDADAPKLRGYCGGVLVRDGMQCSDVDDLAGLLAQVLGAGES